MSKYIWKTCIDRDRLFCMVTMMGIACFFINIAFSSILYIENLS